jgi:hypothetical protein
VSFDGQYPTLVIIKEQTFPHQPLQQGFDLGILKLDNPLLTLVHKTADGRQQDVTGLEKEGHDYRPKTAGLQGWRMKSTS